MKALTVPDLRASAYLAGVLHGDGWCTAKSFGLRTKDHDFAQAFAHALGRVLDVRWLPRRDERGYWLLRGSNKTGRFSRLRHFEPADDQQRAAWLRGLFDSEGNAQLLALPKAGLNSFHRRVAFYSTEISTLDLAAAHLQRLDIAHSVSRTKNSAAHKGSKTVYELRLLRREAFQRFAEVVGSNIGRKQARLDAIASSYQPPGWQARNWAKAVIARYPHLAAGDTA
jgi:hypothetical protein